MATARRPWAEQVAAALTSVGVGISLTALEAVSAKEVAAAGKDAFLAQLADMRSSKVREYVAVTGRGGAGANSLSLPAYLAAIPQRSRRRALSQLRCGSHWPAEETGRWLQVQRNDRFVPSLPGGGRLPCGGCCARHLALPPHSGSPGPVCGVVHGQVGQLPCGTLCGCRQPPAGSLSLALRSLHDQYCPALLLSCTHSLPAFPLTESLALCPLEIGQCMPPPPGAHTLIMHTLHPASTFHRLSRFSD